jgi:hypothetical protein
MNVPGGAIYNEDVISIGKLVQKNDGPEEVEQILSTMIKYGQIKEHQFRLCYPVEYYTT